MSGCKDLAYTSEIHYVARNEEILQCIISLHDDV